MTVQQASQYDLTILFSGGADSLMMFELAKEIRRNPMFVLVDYGQKHKEELEFAKKNLNDAGKTYRIVTIDNLKVDSGLTGSGDKHMYKGVHEMHVPSRNLMLVSIAASISESLGIREIWYGADFSDRVNLFPDCYQEWVVKVNEILKINGSSEIELVAPVLGMTKSHILQYLYTKGYTNDDMFSGYGDL